ncbi:MAG: hypothetical protein LKE36_03520 [Bacilli bacterium]|jgi:hypothetical protein|nr:hypothetical protein [Bacilli bacterium]
MKLRNKILTSTLFILGVSAIMLTGFSYAWINSNNNIAEINLHSGDADAKINGFLFKRQTNQDDNTSIFLNNEPDITATQTNSGNGELSFTFNDDSGTVFSTLNALSLYHDENSISAQAMPGYYVEIQLFTTVETSYMSASLSYASQATAVDFSLFTYRYTSVTNNINSPLAYAAPSIINTLASRSLNPLFQTEVSQSEIITLTDEANGNAYFTNTISTADQAFYKTHFCRSIIVEVMPDPIALISYFKNNPSVSYDDFSIGFSFNLSVGFSLNPIGGN